MPRAGMRIDSFIKDFPKSDLKIQMPQSKEMRNVLSNIELGC